MLRIQNLPVAIASNHIIKGDERTTHEPPLNTRRLYESTSKWITITISIPCPCALTSKPISKSKKETGRRGTPRTDYTQSYSLSSPAEVIHCCLYRGDNSRICLSHHPTTTKKNKKNCDNGEDNWYRGTYTILLSNCPTAVGRIKVNTDRKAWESEDPATFMMLKVRRAILGQREKRGIDLSTHDGQSFMNSTWPWKLLWSSFLKEVNDLKLAALSRTSTATKGHQTRSDELL